MKELSAAVASTVEAPTRSSVARCVEMIIVVVVTPEQKAQTRVKKNVLCRVGVDHWGDVDGRSVERERLPGMMMEKTAAYGKCTKMVERSKS